MAIFTQVGVPSFLFLSDIGLYRIQLFQLFNFNYMHNISLDIHLGEIAENRNCFMHEILDPVMKKT